MLICVFRNVWVLNESHVFQAFQSYLRQQLFHTSDSDPQQSPSYAPDNV